MPRWITRFRLASRAILRRNQVDLELDEELQYHLDRLTDDGVANGLALEEAQHAARRAMGTIAKSKEECRDMRRLNFIDDLIRDLRYAGRFLRRSPGFAALAVFIMALGIGANTAVFSVVSAVLLKPLPYRDPDRIVTLSTRMTGAVDTGQDSIDEQVSIPNFQDWHDQSSSFEAMAYYGSREVLHELNETSSYTQTRPEDFNFREGVVDLASTQF